MILISNTFSLGLHVFILFADPAQRSNTIKPSSASCGANDFRPSIAQGRRRIRLGGRAVLHIIWNERAHDSFRCAGYTIS